MEFLLHARALKGPFFSKVACDHCHEKGIAFWNIRWPGANIAKGS